jgi:Mg2+-importing ATPase
VGFRDTARESAAAAVRELARCGVEVKVVTGDHPLVAARACQEAGLDPGQVVLGDDIDGLADEALTDLAAEAVLFAWFRPEQVVAGYGGLVLLTRAGYRKAFGCWL